MARIKILIALGMVGVITACETVPADPRRQPLRQIETDDDRRYVQCVARDPLFRSEACRQYRASGGPGYQR